MYLIRNTGDDRAKSHLHRMAARFDPEPPIGGERLRRGQSMEVTDEHFGHMAEYIFFHAKNGSLEVEHHAPDGAVTTYNIICRGDGTYDVDPQTVRPNQPEAPKTAPPAPKAQAPAPSEQDIPSAPPAPAEAAPPEEPKTEESKPAPQKQNQPQGKKRLT